jgi:apolipoprotein N-acyltransferase
MKNNYLKLLISGLLLVLAFPPFPFPFLIWIAGVPLLEVLFSIPTESSSSKEPNRWNLFLRKISLQPLWKKGWKTNLVKGIKPYKMAFRYSYFTFFIWNLGACYWLALTAWHVPTDEAFSSFLAGLVAVLLNPLFMSIPILIWAMLLPRLPIWLKGICLIVFWIGFEFLHYNWDLSWSWLTLGNSFTNFPEFLQYAEFTGVLGVSLWILVLNAFAYSVWVGIKSRRVKGLSIIAFLLIACLPLGLNYWILDANREVFQSSTSMNVRVIQPNIDPYVKFDHDGLEAQLTGFYQLADAPGADTIDLVVLPETAIPEAVWTHEISTSELFKGFWTLVAKYPQLSILTGFTELRQFDSPDVSSASRPFDNGYYDYCNSAVIIGSSQFRTHQKGWLVPMVERIPFLDQLRFLKDYNIDIGGGLGSYGKSDSAKALFTRKGVPVGVLICYESAFGNYAREYPLLGASLLTVITNDGWWGRSSGYIQHAGLSVLRAIENRRCVARSANTGISLFVDEKGNRYKEVDWGMAKAIDKKLPLFTHITFYTQYGDYIGKIAVMIGLLFWVLGILKRRNK